MYNVNWSNVPRVEGLVQLLAAGKLELDTSGIDHAAPVRVEDSGRKDRLIVLHGNQIYVQRALEEAILIGTAAREQGWTDTKVSLQFGVLMALKMAMEHLIVWKKSQYKRKRREAKRERKTQREECRCEACAAEVLVF